MPAPILLAIAGAALLAGAGERAASTFTRLTSSAVESGSRRRAAQLDGTSWTINAPIPEPLGVAQGATVASADGSRIYHIGGITGAMMPTSKVRVYSTTDDTWSEAADIPVSPGIRTFGAAVELNGFVYVFGGFDGTNILDSTWIYDEAKDSWFQGANMPAPRLGPAVTTDGALIWVIGGMEGRSVGDETETIWQYDVSADTWAQHGLFGLQLGRLRSVLLPNGDLHSLTGTFDGNMHCRFNIGIPFSSSCPPQLPIGATDPAVVTDGVRIYVLAGAGPAPRGPGRTQVFDTVSRTWFLGPPMPAPGVDNTSGAIANGTLYVMGGYDGVTPVSVNYSLSLAGLGAEELVPTTSTTADVVVEKKRERKVEWPLDGVNPWSINWPLPEGSMGAAQGSTLASSDGPVIYHIGGFVAAGLYTSNRVHAYSPADDTRDASSLRSPWWDVASVPISRGIRSYGSAVELNGFVYIFGGVSGTPSSGEAVLNSTWIYDEANDTWSRGADMPGYRFGPAVATDGVVIWVMGGFNERQGPDHTVWKYDPKADAYSTGFQNMPRDLGRIHGVYLPDGTVHVLGGGGPGPLNNHLVYNTAANIWSSSSPMPLEVLDPATVTDGKLIYLVGAPPFPPRGPAHTQIFDPASEAWWEGPQLPTWPGLGGETGMDNTSGVIANDSFYVMGGAIGGATIWFNYSIPLSELSGHSVADEGWRFTRAAQPVQASVP